MNSDGDAEIVTAHGGGCVHVLSLEGEVVWSNRLISSELRGLALADLDRDGTYEILVNGAVGSRVNTWLYEHNSNLRAGWPQLNNDGGYAYGVFQ